MACRVLGRCPSIRFYHHVRVGCDRCNPEEEWLVGLLKRLLKEVVGFVRGNVGRVLPLVADRLPSIAGEVCVFVFIRVYVLACQRDRPVVNARQIKGRDTYTGRGENPIVSILWLDTCHSWTRRVG
jgi:hypothetical protein